MLKNDREPEHGPGRLPHLLRIDELAQRLGVSERHLRRLVQERRIPSLKVGHFVMFDEREIVPAPGGRTPAVGVVRGTVSPLPSHWREVAHTPAEDH